MTLKELLDKTGAEDQLVALLVHSEWRCIFPAAFCPKEYDDYVVEAFMPDEFNGDSPFDGLVLKVWLKDPDNSSVIQTDDNDSDFNKTLEWLINMGLGHEIQHYEKNGKRISSIEIDEKNISPHGKILLTFVDEKFSGIETCYKY